MLLALTRPARSVDLSKLDIRARSFTSTGVTFKAQHLSKQSRSSNLWLISFTLGIQRITQFAQ